MKALTRICLGPYKGIQDSLGFWIPYRRFWILGTGFQSLSVELWFWIAIVSGIPDSLSCIPDSKVHDSGFHRQIFPDSGFQVLDSSLCQWNFDFGLQSLVGFRIPWVVFRIPKSMIPDSTSKFSQIPHSGYWICQWNFDFGLQPLLGFRIPWAVFRIPKPRIPGSTSKNFLDSGIWIPYISRSVSWCLEPVMKHAPLCLM